MMARQSSKSAARSTKADSQGRWTRRAAQRPDEILNAALEVFVAKGFDGARMDDVAAAAGLSKGSIYLYFDSKVAMLKALIAREVEPIARRAEAVALAGTANPIATLQQLAAFVAERLLEPRTFAVPRLVISVAARFPEIADYYRKEVVDRGRGAIRSLIGAGIAQGTFRAVDLDVAVRAIVGPILFVALYRHVLNGPRPSSINQVVERQLEFALRALEAEAP